MNTLVGRFWAVRHMFDTKITISCFTYVKSLLIRVHHVSILLLKIVFKHVGDKKKTFSSINNVMSLVLYLPTVN